MDVAHAAVCRIPKAYGSYQELIDDPSLTAIYVATPNGLHGDWAAAALKAGKHVLCEKPFTANADEAKAVQHTAAKCKLLCREAFHYKVGITCNAHSCKHPNLPGCNTG